MLSAFRKVASIKSIPGVFIFIEVADNGCGMDEETKHRLFDPFLLRQPIFAQ